MMMQFLYASPMAIVVLGAIVLMLLSNSRITLHRLNFIAVGFLLLSLVVQFFIYGEGESTYLFENIFGTAFILDDFASIFDAMFTIGSILTLLINNDYFRDRRYFAGEYFALILFSFSY